MGQMILDFIMESGFAQMDIKQVIVIALACFFLYLAIAKGYEPYLLIPIATVTCKHARCRFNESST